MARLVASRATLLGFALGAVLITVATVLVGPQFGGVDAYIFKGPGCAWAGGQGFTAFALPGYADLTPRLFASYVPGLPVLFGLYAKLFGCTPWSDTFFDLLMGLGSSYGVILVLDRPAAPTPTRICLGLLGGLAGSIGVASTSPDRPEALAMILFVAACLSAASSNPKFRRWAAPPLAGTVALVHPFAGMVAGVVVWSSAVALEMAGNTKFDRPSTFRLATVSIRVAALYCAPLALVIAWYIALDPSFGSRFLGHAAGKSTGIGAIFNGGYGQLIRRALTAEPPSSYLSGLCIVIALAVIGWMNVTHLTIDRRIGNILTALVCSVILLLLIALFPGQGNYWRWAVVAVAVTIATAPTLFGAPTPAGRSAMLLFAVAALTLILSILLNFTMRAEAHRSYAAAKREAHLLWEGSSPADRSGIIVVPSNNYFLYRMYFSQLLNPSYVSIQSPEVASKITSAASCYGGRLPGMPVPDAGAMPRSLSLVSRASDHVRVALFGRTMRSEWGWGCDDYRK